MSGSGSRSPSRSTGCCNTHPLFFEAVAWRAWATYASSGDGRSDHGQRYIPKVPGGKGAGRRRPTEHIDRSHTHLSRVARTPTVQNIANLAFRFPRALSLAQSLCLPLVCTHAWPQSLPTSGTHPLTLRRLPPRQAGRGRRRIPGRSASRCRRCYPAHPQQPCATRGA